MSGQHTVAEGQAKGSLRLSDTAPHPGFAAAMAFEATKLWAVRSTRVTLLAALIVHLGLTWMVAFSAKASGEHGYEALMPAPFMSLASLQLAQLLIAALAALAITSEYSNGTMISSLQAVPSRSRLLGAKATVLGMLGLVSGVLLVGIGTFVAAPTAAEYGAFTLKDVMLALVGGGVYLGLLAMMMVGIGALLRSTAGAITASFVLIFALPQILPLFNVQWVQTMATYLPTNAGQVLGMGLSEPYGVGTAALVLVLWAVVLLGAGMLVFKRRDA